MRAMYVRTYVATVEPLPYRERVDLRDDFHEGNAVSTMFDA